LKAIPHILPLKWGTNLVIFYWNVLHFVSRTVIIFENKELHWGCVKRPKAFSHNPRRVGLFPNPWNSESNHLKTIFDNYAKNILFNLSDVFVSGVPDWAKYGKGDD
jgi:hypothetical protein